jgi:release factor glutamine methyltransferase
MGADVCFPGAMPLTLDDVVARLRAAGCVFAEEEADLMTAGAPTAEELEELVRRRAEGEPLEHLLGWVEFAGLRLVVTPGVFVPRRRTELLAREAVRVARPGDVLAELCCGCAPVGAVSADRVPGLTVVAADIDPEAVRCAATNLPAPAETCCGDLFAALPARHRGRIDVLVANAPYVPTDAVALMPREARLHEPVVALDGGADGLDVHRRLLAEAPQWLSATAHLLVEVGQEQVEDATSLFDRHGFTCTVVRDDEIGGIVLKGQRAAY